MKKQINAGALEEPQPFYIPLGRRRFFKSLAIASAGFTLPGYLAEALTLTSRLTQGPYYPLANNMPLDTTFHSASLRALNAVFALTLPENKRCGLC